jgi:hypothetical protein
VAFVSRDGAFSSVELSVDPLECPTCPSGMSVGISEKSSSSFAAVPDVDGTANFAVVEVVGCAIYGDTIGGV